jgi:hypothetical protein
MIGISQHAYVISVMSVPSSNASPAAASYVVLVTPAVSGCPISSPPRRGRIPTDPLSFVKRQEGRRLTRKTYP